MTKARPTQSKTPRLTAQLARAIGKPSRVRKAAADPKRLRLEPVDAVLVHLPATPPPPVRHAPGAPRATLADRLAQHEAAQDPNVIPSPVRRRRLDF